jgi:hypothetical protein
MENTLTIRTGLSHDGDGLVRLDIIAESEGFSGMTLAWANCQKHLELATLLEGFPKASGSQVTFQFGSPRTGTCNIDVFCLDAARHTGIWVTIEAPYKARGTSDYERTKLFIRVEPSAIDRFVAALRGFVPNEDNEAVLHGVSQY